MSRHAHQVDKRQHFDPSDVQVRYPEQPTSEPGLVGGPATTAVPTPRPCGDSPSMVTDDGGETTLAGQSREEGGERPPRNATNRQKQEG
jgi:hypothetical protein